jgi:DNA-binding transcriptional LysR family regulator
MNYVSQSAVSQAITKLESIFGAELVFHNRQKLQLTEQGKVVFDRAQLIFKTVQDTFEEVNQAKDIVTGTLNFVSTTSLCMSFIAPCYKKIRKTFPDLDFKYRTGNLNLIRTALKREDAEFAIVVYSDHFEQFAKHPLAKGSVRLYQAKKTSQKLIHEGVFVDNLDGMFVQELKDYFDEKGNHHFIQGDVASWELTAWYTHLGIGVGFFPDYILCNNRYPNIQEHPLEIPQFEYEICAIYNKGAKLSRLAHTFIDQLCFNP